MTRAPDGLLLSDAHLALATDLYQLTMMASYLHWDMAGDATFELFVRRLPTHRGYLVAAGLEQCLHYLEQLHFDGDAIDFLRSHDVFAHVDPTFFERLRSYRFSGDVWAIPEGVPVFPNEPILQVRAPLFEAQLVETYLLSTINFQTSIASKAARVCQAAHGRACVDFGTRRAHGPQAGVYAARAAYIGGVVGTSNVFAGQRCGIPVMGTAAHAYTMACPSEDEAFRRYHATFPDHTTLLIDTYDTLRGAERATEIEGTLRGVRLDSGDLSALAKQVRHILDARGRSDTRIVASGDLNEYKIKALLDDGAPIDVFGIGTELVTSKDHPALGGVYKLVERTTEAGETEAVIKLAEGKMTYPGTKQIWRRHDAHGHCCGDVMQLADSPSPGADATPLLIAVVEGGRRVYDPPPLQAIQARCKEALAKLPETLLAIEAFGTYPVDIGDDVQALVTTLSQRHGTSS